MPGNRLENIRVAFLLTDGVDQIGLTSPREALLSEGAVVHLLAPAERDETHTVQAWSHLHPGDKFDIDSTIEEANPEDYDAVYLPGGLINGDRLRTVESAHDFLRHVYDQEKPIFVFCHGGWTLISAGLVRGREMTSYRSIRDDMINAGARWVDEPVVTDQNLISSRHPGDLPMFNKAMVEKLASLERAHAHRG